MRLSPSRSGSANKSPVTNWLETLPSSSKSPLRRFPQILISRSVLRKPIPRCRKRSSYTLSGRSISLLLPASTVSIPVISAIGMKKRSVLPLSLQFSCFGAAALRMSIPDTLTVSPSFSHCTPRALRQSIVASMSSESEMPCTTHSPSESPAQISRRCATLFDGGAQTVPRAIPFSIFIFISSSRAVHADNPMLQGTHRFRVP